MSTDQITQRPGPGSPPAPAQGGGRERLIQSNNAGEPGQPLEPQDAAYIPDSTVDELGDPL